MPARLATAPVIETACEAAPNADEEVGAAATALFAPWALEPLAAMAEEPAAPEAAEVAALVAAVVDVCIGAGEDISEQVS